MTEKEILSEFNLHSLQHVKFKTENSTKTTELRVVIFYILLLNADNNNQISARINLVFYNIMCKCNYFSAQSIERPFGKYAVI